MCINAHHLCADAELSILLAAVRWGMRNVARRGDGWRDVIDAPFRAPIPGLSRRSLLVGTAITLTGCRSGRRPMPTLVHRPVSALPGTVLTWLSLRDHFVATVGPRAGEGRPLGPLLVLADATFAPRSRFPLHPHEEMEILSIVVDGTLSHHGDQAHDTALGPQSAQLISARSGMVHAEGNDTDTPTRMLQLWFEPDRHGGAPAYFSRQLAGVGRQLVAGDEGMPLRADARVWWLSVLSGAPEPLVVQPGRRGYLLALTGPIRAEATNGSARVVLEPGDGAELEQGEFVLAAEGARAALWIDLPSGTSS